MIVIPENHEAWLKEREYGLGASEAASYLGLSKWKSNLQLWEEKTGLRKPEDISGKSFVQYGHDAEPHLRALFALDHPELRVTYESPFKIIRNDEHPFIFCTPDGELEEIGTGHKGGLEIKTTEIQNQSQWSEWRGRIPNQYFCQVMHQMIASGWDFVYVLAQIKWTTKTGEKRKEIREYRIERGDHLADIEFTKNGAIKFWRSIEENKKPALILPGI